MKTLRFIYFLIAILLFSSCKSFDKPHPAALTLTSVKTSISPVSKAIIETTQLSDGSTIGVAVVSSDGSSYEGRNYNNVAFSANSSSGSQIWTGSTPVLLSPTKATLYSYYPYNPSVSDVKSVPVETDSQTDYMYATPVENVSSANSSPSIRLNHALAAIRLSLIRGSYSGSGAITAVGVRTPAAGKSAIMDATTGRLSSFVGIGELSSVTTSLTLSGTAQDQNVLVVPNNASGEVTLQITIDGRTFEAKAAALVLTPGKIYKYDVIINNKDLSLSSVSVGDWSFSDAGDMTVDVGKKVKITGNLEGIALSTQVVSREVIIQAIPLNQADSILPVTLSGSALMEQNGNTTTNIRTIQVRDIKSDCEILFPGLFNFDEITLCVKFEPVANETVSFTVNTGFGGKIDWGDGTINQFTASGNSGTKTCSHKYTSEGSFTAYIVGECSQICFKKSPITEVCSIGEKCVLESYYAFYECRKLSKIPSDLFSNNPLATNFEYCFSNCSSLTNIPSELFSNNINVTRFVRCFSNCSSLINIPSELFSNNINVTHFNGCFENCSNLINIPSELFSNNLKVLEIGCFSGCSGLTDIPGNLFSNNINVTSFYSCFSNCNKLTNIPSELFSSNTRAKEFYGCFSGCSGLTDIPGNLFSNNINVTSFVRCFSGCSGLTDIPGNLFSNNINVTSFYSCFSNCNKLTSIPSELFSNNLIVTDFSNCFLYCNKVTGESPYSIKDGIKIHLYERSLYPQYYPVYPTSFGSAFYMCYNFSDFVDIPLTWK